MPAATDARRYNDIVTMKRFISLGTDVNNRNDSETPYLRYRCTMMMMSSTIFWNYTDAVILSQHTLVKCKHFDPYIHSYTVTGRRSPAAMDDVYAVLMVIC